MQAIILAAGMGKRLKELTQNNTKCMVKVNGVRLIDRVLGQLAKLGLKRTVLVTGYEGEKLRRHVGRKWNGMRIDYIDNPVYGKTNNIYSLALAADELVKDDTLLIESDLIFEDSIFEKVLKDPHPNVAVVDAYQSWMDGTCVQIDENIYKFSKAFSKEDYVPFLQAYSKALGANEYYEQVLRVISLLDKPLMHALPLTGEKWYEIDDVQDLDIAESMFCSPEEQVKKLSSRFGGYWRYPGLMDFCYLVTPYFPGNRLRAELKASFDALLEQYPSGQRVNALLAAKMFGLHAEEIAVGNGAAEIINAYMGLLGGRIGFVYPTFEEYPNRIGSSRRVAFQPSAENGFRYGAKDLIAFFTKNPVSNLVVVNPDNPSGNFMPVRDIERLCGWCEKKGLRLLIDESFADFADKPYTLLSREFLSKYPNTSVMKSISKSYGVPGLRLGVFASSRTAVVNLVKQSLSIWNINSFGEFFLQIIEKYLGGYRHGCVQLAAERNRFIRELAQTNCLTVYPSAANYVLCRVHAPQTPRNLMMELWKRHRILIKDCSHKKGFDGAPFIRLAVRDTSDNNALVAAIKEIGSGCAEP